MHMQNKVTAQYVKSSGYEAHPIHGVYGGLNSNGLVAMSVYSEGHRLPDSAELTLHPGDNGEQKIVEELIGNTGIERLVHATYYMDVDMARVVVDWLNDKIKHFDAINGISEA